MKSGAKGGSGAAELDPRVSRRDFLNTTLLGAGAALLNAPAPAFAQDAAAGWNGYGGVGDYRNSNGDTWDVTDAAHRIRDGRYDAALKDVVDTGESYDLVVVGAGFNGLAALYEFTRRKPGGTALLIDNQEIFGGFAKSNDFDVDGHRVSAAQATLNFVQPSTPQEREDDDFDALGLPQNFRFLEREDGRSPFKIQKSSSGSLYFGEQCATTGYYFRNAQTGDEGRWVKDIFSDDLERAPLPAAYKAGLLRLRARKREGRVPETLGPWLDSMSLAEFATRELKVAPEVLTYVTQGMGITGPQLSAYGAQSFPGLERYAEGTPGAAFGERFISFPAGNATLMRHFVKALFPDAIRGPRTLEAIASGPVDFNALDRPGAARRMRLRATAVRVKHEGDPSTAERVEVVYEKGGKLFRVRAKAVVLSIGAWVAKHIVADLPADRRALLDQYLYSPALMINVALRNWRFLDRLGFATGRCMDGGPGFYWTIRQPMAVGVRPPPFHPDKPIVMTLYMAPQTPGLPLEAQGPAARGQMFATSYADYEAQVVAQMRAMFSAGGFDARRDIAGMALNRWGHAYITPPPGFFFGKNGGPAPARAADAPIGRIALANGGMGSWQEATHMGKRALNALAAAL